MVKLKRIYEPTTATPLKRHRKPEFASSAIILTHSVYLRVRKFSCSWREGPGASERLRRLEVQVKENFTFSHDMPYLHSWGQLEIPPLRRERNCQWISVLSNFIWIQFFSDVFGSVAVHAEYALDHNKWFEGDHKAVSRPRPSILCGERGMNHWLEY